MKQIVIASHERFAFGLKETLKFITSIEQIHDISAYTSQDERFLHDVVADLFARFNKDDKVVILTDILSGSVNQEFLPYINDNTFLIAGTNVPLALSLLLTPEEDIDEQKIRDNIEEAKQSIVFINDMNFSNDEDDE